VAEYSYLTVSARRDGRDGRVLLSGKRNVPAAWLFAFAGPQAAPVREARARARRRVERLRPGPRLAAVFDGFLGLLESLADDQWLLVDVTEMGDAGEAHRREALAIVAALDAPDADPRALDLEEWEVSDLELDDHGRDSSYLFFGGPEEEEYAWLRPPEAGDAAAIADVLRAMKGYTRLSGPVATARDLRFAFRHPAHAGVVFAVRIVEGELELSAHGSERAAEDPHDFESIAFGPLDDAGRLAAWAEHLAAHFSSLRLPSREEWAKGFHWWTSPGGAEFGERMKPYDADARALRDGVATRLANAVGEFLRWQWQTKPRAAFDLGALGHLSLERVEAPEWEPHFFASVRPGPADATWRAPDPGLLVPPSQQNAIVGEVLAALARSPEGWPVATTVRLFADRVEPPRFTSDGSPPRARTFEETPATIVFCGANLLVVTANGARLSFRFPVPPELGPSTPVFVSGWWTARSGDRFASVLRFGGRTLHFDNDGKLLGR
jgi:hypothetical protein